MEVEDLLLESLKREDEELEPTRRRIEWCSPQCINRHGVVRNIKQSEISTVRRMLAYYFGATDNKGAWWKKNPSGTYSVEFNHQCKVSPPPDKPWAWCGKSMLFAEWQQQVQAIQQASKKFRIGDRVSFTNPKQGTLTGIIIGGGSKNATVLIGSQRWRVTWSLLSRAS